MKLKSKQLGALYLAYRYARGRKVKKYHEGSCKSPIRIFLEMMLYYFRNGETLSLYYAMGYNVKGSDVSGYIGKKKINRIKERAERKLKATLGVNFDYTIVTKDKFYAAAILRANGIPTLEDIAFIVNGTLVTPQNVSQTMVGLDTLGDSLVFKNTTVEAGEGVLFIDYNLESSKLLPESTMERINHGVWVVQKQTQAHPEIRKINGSALNTLRIVTIYNGINIELLGAYQAFATRDTKKDSWGDDGIYVGIDVEKGCLKGFGYTNPWGPGKGIVTQHPDSKVKFANFPIPYFHDAVSMCIHGHWIFHTNYFLGWDLAITENGPVVVEVNERPGMNVFQCITGELRYNLTQRIVRIDD